jgi:hypothetical protein
MGPRRGGAIQPADAAMALSRSAEGWSAADGS